MSGGPSFHKAFGVIEAINAEHAGRIRSVNEAHAHEMRKMRKELLAAEKAALDAVRAEYRPKVDDADARLKATLKALLQWRNDALRTAGVLPIRRSKVATVCHVTGDGARVSLAAVGSDKP